MKLNRLCKIHKCVADDQGRYAMNHAKLEIDADGKARLVATDGRMLAVVPVTETEADTAGFVSPEVIAEALKGSGDAEAEIVANGSLRVQTKRGRLEFDRPPEGAEYGREFPRWRQVVPKGDVVHRIALNPQYLLAVAEAIGSGSSVVLEWRENGAPLVVRPAGPIGGGHGDVTLEDFESRFGLVMPISINVVPEGAPMTAGQKAAATRKKRQQEKAAAEKAAAEQSAAPAPEPAPEQPADVASVDAPGPIEFVETKEFGTVPCRWERWGDGKERLTVTDDFVREAADRGIDVPKFLAEESDTNEGGAS